MFLHVQQLINEIVPDEPDPAAANALQEGLGGQFGEMRTMMQYLFQSFNFRGSAAAKPYKDLLSDRGLLDQAKWSRHPPWPAKAAGTGGTWWPLVSSGVRTQDVPAW
jgi:Manganese containing catalase